MADPTQIVQNQVGFAPEIAPYAQTLLGNAELYTNLEQNPYQQYQGDRTAQFTPLQQQAFENAGLMQSSPQLQDASAMAGQAGLGALNTQYTYNPSNFGATDAKNLMNPYMQNVVDMQKREAARASGVQGAQQGAQAAGAGAFGGSRDAIMAAERQRNLGQQMNDIQATGLNNAYNQAQNQYNTQNQLNAQQQQFGAGLGLQGLQVANTAAQNLSGIGQNQYTQNMGINQLQNATGTQQQQQAQNVLNNQYTDFQNYQNYPYKQMAFMSDMLRGTPLSATGSTVYQAPPSTAQTVASLGMGAAGLSKLFAKGGEVQSHGLGGLALRQLAGG